MKLKFENWLDKNDFKIDAKHLFISAVKCYKADVQTAALLLSYLGFMVVLKHRILSANKPKVFPQPTWDKIQNGILNEDKWEENVLNAVLQQEKKDSANKRIQDPVFVISENLRTQIKYWKDRRNDCAHNKDNQIMQHNVEAFWGFLESNLAKIFVEGGRTNLINKFSRHFNISYTPANTDVSPLVKEIKYVVDKNELNSFWGEMFEVVADLFDHGNEIKVAQNIFKLDDPVLTESLVKHLLQERNFWRAFISEDPGKLSLFLNNEQEIRNFWRNELLKTVNPLKVYASMLRNNLIPPKEVEEANKHVFKMERYDVSPEDHAILVLNGFGEVFYEKLFVDNNPSNRKYWKFINDNIRIYVSYISSFPLKDEVVRIVVSELNKDEWRPQFLENDLNLLFEKNSNKKKEFAGKISSLKLSWPACLK